MDADPVFIDEDSRRVRDDMVLDFFHIICGAFFKELEEGGLRISDRDVYFESEVLDKSHSLSVWSSSST